MYQKEEQLEILSPGIYPYIFDVDFHQYGLCVPSFRSILAVCCIQARNFCNVRTGLKYIYAGWVELDQPSISTLQNLFREHSIVEFYHTWRRTRRLSRSWSWSWFSLSTFLWRRFARRARRRWRKRAGSLLDMIGKLLQTKFSHILPLELSLKRSTILRLVTTCEHIWRIFVYFQGRNQFGINFTNLDNSIKHMRQLLQLLIVTSTFLALPL